MPKPVIAVDVDEVLSPYVEGLINWHNSNFGTSFQFKDFTSYEFHRIWGGTQEIAIDKSSQYFENRNPSEASPLKDAKSVLEKLKNDYDLIVVTSRRLVHKPHTETWIQENFPSLFKEIIICNHWSNGHGQEIKKSEACLKHGANFLIDDLAYYVTDAAQAGVTGLLFGNYPWNKQMPAHPKIQRLTDWQAIQNYFYQN